MAAANGSDIGVWHRRSQDVDGSVVVLRARYGWSVGRRSLANMKGIFIKRLLVKDEARNWCLPATTTVGHGCLMGSTVPPAIVCR